MRVWQEEKGTLSRVGKVCLDMFCSFLSLLGTWQTDIHPAVNAAHKVDVRGRSQGAASYVHTLARYITG